VPGGQEVSRRRRQRPDGSVPFRGAVIACDCPEITDLGASASRVERWRHQLVHCELDRAQQEGIPECVQELVQLSDQRIFSVQIPTNVSLVRPTKFAPVERTIGPIRFQ
jgi:hypothetical protein